jgi:tripartite-type tricarboxylate transporter receptor subunit TctC
MTLFSRAVLAAALCAIAHASAQTYPVRPIRLVVPFAPGGNVDITARVVSNELRAVIGQSVLVDNRAGGGGSVAAAAVAKATPDGYTLLMGSSGPLSINPVAMPSLAYDPIKDFAPVSRVHSVPLVLLASQKMDIRSVKEVIERAKAAPGKFTIASAGIGTMNHFAIELFSVTANIKVLHVPYKGGGPALNDLLGGQVSATFEQLNSSMDPIRDGRVTALAISSLKRSSALPNIPTLDEVGLKGYEASTFVAVLAPAGTPKPVVTKLNDAVRKVMESPTVLNRLREMGTEPGSSSPEELGALVASELNKWRDVATKADLKFE